jgi:hypothetical protein
MSSSSNPIGDKSRPKTCFKKKLHGTQARHRSPFKVHYEYIAIMPFVYVHAVLSQPLSSFVEKIKNKNW